MSLLGSVRERLQTRFSAHIGKRVRLYTFITFLAALVYVFLYPASFISRKTYYSENALLVGSAHSNFQYAHAKYAIQISKLFCEAHDNSREFLKRTLHSLGFEVTKQQPHNNNNNNYNNNVYAIFRAPKGSGKESIALSSPLFVGKSCDNLGLVVSLLRMLSQAKWLHHDLVFIGHYYNATNASTAGTGPSYLSSLFKNLYNSNDTNTSSGDDMTDSDMLVVNNAGVIREAIHVDFATFAVPSHTLQLAIQCEGINGEQPNLDLVNVITGYAKGVGVQQVSTTGKVLTFDGAEADVDPIYTYLTSRDRFYAPLSPTHRQWLAQYLNLWRGLWNLVKSWSTGLHGQFRAKSAHSVTLGNTAKQEAYASTNYLNNFGDQLLENRERNMLLVGQVVESTVRSMNSLIEKLHQSFFMYFMMSEEKFVGFEDFFATMWLFTLPFVIQLFGYYYDAVNLHTLTSMARAAYSVAINVMVCWSLLFLLSATTSALHGSSALGAASTSSSSVATHVALPITLVVLAVLVLWHQRRHWSATVATSSAESKKSERQLQMVFSCLYITLGLCIFTVYQAPMTIFLSCYCFLVNSIALWQFKRDDKDNETTTASNVTTIVSRPPSAFKKFLQVIGLLVLSPLVVAFVLFIVLPYLTTVTTTMHSSFLQGMWNYFVSQQLPNFEHLLSTGGSGNNLYLAFVVYLLPTWLNMLVSVLYL